MKLPHLDGWNAQRREAAARYRDALAGLPVEPPARRSGSSTCSRSSSTTATACARRCARPGIGTGIHYPRPVHLNPAWSQLGAPGDHPAAERLAERTLSLPMFPGIEPAEIDRVAEALRAVVPQIVVDDSAVVHRVRGRRVASQLSADVEPSDPIFARSFHQLATSRGSACQPPSSAGEPAEELVVEVEPVLL